MPMKTKRPAPPCRAATGQVAWESSTALDANNSKPLADFQGAFLAARFGLDGTRARVVAELAWGR